MFALCQSLPGPGSTKMLYAINLIRSGFIVGLLSFFLWRFVPSSSMQCNAENTSLPGAIAACGLAIGISKINEALPAPVYALLTGLNSATVGIVALAAVQLSTKAITDDLTRILVFVGGTAGMLYNALWYYPVLMIAGGLATVLWDYKWPQSAYQRFKTIYTQSPRRDSLTEAEAVSGDHEMRHVSHSAASTAESHRAASTIHRSATQRQSGVPSITEDTEDHVQTQRPSTRVFSWGFGVSVIAVFFSTFIVVMILRGSIKNPPLGFSLFANLYLAGTIIFGGGPVVIPLLREYVVNEGWVSPRDFLLGLAIVQAFPGPNFNFAVYLGALTLLGSGSSAVAGAVIGYLAIFTPGLALHTGTMGIWKVVRRYRWVTSALRGINATAVGLIYAAVYRLWEIGFLSMGSKGGASLGGDPWWLVVSATSFVGGMWFRVEAPVAILMGGVLGLIWNAVVTA